MADGQNPGQGATSGGDETAEAKANGSTNGKRLAKPAVAAVKALDRARTAEPAAVSSSMTKQFAQFQTDAPTCDQCGAITVRCGNCYLCYNCGASMGCS
jgi:ribonucleoside-diphosphate reductase alpha chain